MSRPASYRGPQDSRQDAVRHALEVLGCRTVLDVGAHNGHLSAYLADSGMEVVAVDDNHHIRHQGVRSIRKHLTPADLPAMGKFDAVVALSVLHHCEDWRGMLAALRKAARRCLVVEPPHPAEQLLHARHRKSLVDIHMAVLALDGVPLTMQPATRQPHLMREVKLVPPLLAGHVFSGGGHHARSQSLYGDQFEAVLGWRPYPGSLNLRLDQPGDLGDCMWRLRPDAKRDYRLWRARLAWNRKWPQGVPVAVMDVGRRGHGEDCVELLAPVRLREHLALEDGHQVEVELLW